MKSKRTSYADKLKDPRWQQKRLKILERDEWTCQWCGDRESELHVHHLVYRKQVDPWDVPETDLLTLCKTCHTNDAYPKSQAILEVVTSFLREGYLTCHDITTIAETLNNLREAYGINPQQFAEILDVNIYKEVREYVHDQNMKEQIAIEQFLKTNR